MLDEVRPGLMADGGNVALHEIDGLVVVLKLQGACGSCPSSTMTLRMGIETKLRDKIPEILEVEQILDTETGLELNEENVEKVRGMRSSITHTHTFIRRHKSCAYMLLKVYFEDHNLFSDLLHADYRICQPCYRPTTRISNKSSII